MPKKKEPKLTERKDGRAVVHWKGKMHVMGKNGTREARIAFHRFCAELQSNPTGFIPPTKAPDATVKELGAAFLDHLLERTDETNYTVHRILVVEFLAELYGDTPADQFSTTCLDAVRQAMKRSERFNRSVLNGCVKVQLRDWET